MSKTCGHCGGTVMPYYRFVAHMKPTATCDNCQKRVRLRGYNWMATATIIAFALIVVGVITDFLVLWHFLVIIPAAILIDFWAWKAVPWDPEPSGNQAESSREPGG